MLHCAVEIVRSMEISHVKDSACICVCVTNFPSRLRKKCLPNTDSGGWRQAPIWQLDPWAPRPTPQESPKNIFVKSCVNVNSCAPQSSGLLKFAPAQFCSTGVLWSWNGNLLEREMFEQFCAIHCESGSFIQQCKKVRHNFKTKTESVTFVQNFLTFVTLNFQSVNSTALSPGWHLQVMRMLWSKIYFCSTNIVRFPVSLNLARIHTPCFTEVAWNRIIHPLLRQTLQL